MNGYREMKTLVSAIVLTVLASGSAGADGALHKLPAIADAAPEAVQISPHVPHMGQHWAVKDDLPVGPIYCVIEGRIVCVEYMFDAEDLVRGTDWTALPPRIETPPITHIDVEFKPEGIDPRPVPLYQVHIYFVDKDVLAGH